MKIKEKEEIYHRNKIIIDDHGKCIYISYVTNYVWFTWNENTVSNNQNFMGKMFNGMIQPTKNHPKHIQMRQTKKY